MIHFEVLSRKALLKIRNVLRLRDCLQRALVVFLAAVVFCQPVRAQQLTPLDQHMSVRVALQWLPQSQFAGYYIAQQQGYYKSAGLDVELLHTGPGPTSLDLLQKGEADFATLFLADAITAPASTQLVNIAQLLQTSNLMLVAWKDAGVHTPKDLDGRMVSYWPAAFSVAYSVFFEQHGIHPRIVPQHYTVNLFLERGVTAAANMLYNEYHRIYQAGIDREALTVFFMRDYGLNFPEDGVYTTSQMAGDHPEACLALRQATIRGWEYARLHPEETISLVLAIARRHGVPANRPHARWMLDHVLASIFAMEDDTLAGVLDRATYEKTAETLKKAGMIKEFPSFDLFAPLERPTK